MHKTLWLQLPPLMGFDPKLCVPKSHRLDQTRWMGFPLCQPNMSRSWRSSTCRWGAFHSTADESSLGPLERSDVFPRAPRLDSTYPLGKQILCKMDHHRKVLPQ